MKLETRRILLGTACVGAAMILGACAGGYVEGGGAVVETDYYGPVYGGAVSYGHPYYRNDSHFVAPPHQAWHGGAPAHAAPAEHAAGRSAPASGDRDRK